MTLAPDHQHFLDLAEISTGELRKILEESKRLKAVRKARVHGDGPLAAARGSKRGSKRLRSRHSHALRISLRVIGPRKKDRVSRG